MRAFSISGCKMIRPGTDNDKFLLFLLLSLLPLPVRADTGRTGAILMRQPLGSRPFALGQAYSALGDDAFAMSYNPASLGRLHQSEFAAQFFQAVEDTRLGYGIFTTPLNPNHALGFGVAYMDEGKTDIFNDTGQSIGTVHVQRDLLLHLAYGYSITMDRSRLHLGTGAKLLKSTLADQAQAFAYAGDFGGLYEFPWANGLASLGVSVLNFGPGIRYSGGIATGSETDVLPLNTRFGLGYLREVFQSDRLGIGIEANRIFYDNDLSEAIGIEYTYHRLCALRTGYRWGPGGGISVGLGLQSKGLSIDYGLGLLQTFNNLQQLSISYKFDIPGIRYSQWGESPTQRILDDINQLMTGQQFFTATSRLDRFQSLFPNSSEVIHYKRRLEAELQQMLAQGPQGPWYHYAYGFKFYESKAWEDAAANLEISLRRHSENAEIHKYLNQARKNAEQANRMKKLEQQATIGTLYEIASKAYETADHVRAKRVLQEILRVAPYQPATSLLDRILRTEGRPIPSRVHSPPPVSHTRPPQSAISPQAAAQAEALYYSAVRHYAETQIGQALSDVQEGLRLDPENENLKITLDAIQKEIQKRQAR